MIELPKLQELAYPPITLTEEQAEELLEKFNENVRLKETLRDMQTYVNRLLSRLESLEIDLATAKLEVR